MKRAALKSQGHYAVRQLAEAITSGLPSKAYVDEYIAIYYYVLTHTRYMRDPRTVELVRDPWLIAKEILAGGMPAVDCDDLTALLCALVLAVGGQCRIVTVAFRHMHHNGVRQFSHVFAEAREPTTGKWIVLDPVAADHTRSMLRRSKAAKIWPVA